MSMSASFIRSINRRVNSVDVIVLGHDNRLNTPVYNTSFQGCKDPIGIFAAQVLKRKAELLAKK